MSRRVLSFAVLLTVLVTGGAFGVGDGSASSGRAAAYRGHVNGICRSYTPRLKKIEADALAARKVGDRQRMAYDLGLGIALSLRQDGAIERVAVPPELQRLMTPRLRLLTKIDGYLRRVLSSARAGDQAGTVAALRKISVLARPLNSMFDSAGLHCGSNQT